MKRYFVTIISLLLTIGGYDNGSRFWVGENWIGRGLLRKSQKEVMLPIVDKYTGTTVFIPGEEFIPIKDI